ncbi:formyltransferase family protein [Robertmurraya massiliosenegalensis]|uniref:formyltransferase family protein n=1 Tax=Robertmurraya massiliosenegalensis TaxID=1287657 RepID=UPI0002EB7BB3|nr:formyltransferase family protein [Robertmurraya massiliosenegalensis]
MKVVLLTGSHPRHFYVVNQLAKLGIVAGHVIEQRESFVPEPPQGLEPIDHWNFIRHFQDRDEAEHRFFAGNEKVVEGISSLNVTIETLNSQETINFIKEISPDIVISYGVHKLDANLLQALPEHSWNIHGGLSPWYKGNITLFWPFYMLRPNWAGMTIHKLSVRLDGGDIIHHSVPELSYGDGVHDVACKGVQQVAHDLIKILTELKLEQIRYTPQKGNGKLYVGTDWTPQHLRLIYQTYNNDIVDHFLDGKLSKIEPKLVNAFQKE